MINSLKQITRMQAALWVNAFCFYFKRLWLIGKLMPDSIYSGYRLKKVLGVAAVVVRQLIGFCTKPLYLLCFVGLPLLFLPESSPLKGQEFALMVHILFFLNCLLGSFGDSHVFAVTRDKLTFVKYLHMSARSYTQGSFVFKYLPFFLFYLPWLLISARLLGGTLLQGTLLWLLLLAFRLMGEAFQLLFFARTGKVLSRSMIYQWVMIATGLLGAYLPLLLGGTGPLAAVLLHPFCALLYMVLGGVSLWYIFAGYSGYEGPFRRCVDPDFLFSSLMKASGSASFKEVEVKETDLAVSAAKTAGLKNLHGYAYLNALFFARHKRQLIKPLYYRLAFVGLILAAALALLFTNRPVAVALSQNLTASLLPSSVFIMYCMTIADKACRSMFYNCDKDMLHFSYYRQPGVILKNFQIRLVRVMLYNGVVAGALCLSAVVFCLLCGTSVFSLDLLLFCVTLFLLSALFTAHHLCLYYIFQPYSENLQVKNPFYSVINIIIYILCCFCLQIEAGGSAFTLSVLGFTVLYIAAALVLVYRFAPKTFRVK